MYENISKVIEHISANTINRYLAVGWKLLHVGQFRDEEYSHTLFVIGWDSSNGDPKEPEV